MGVPFAAGLMSAAVMALFALALAVMRKGRRRGHLALLAGAVSFLSTFLTVWPGFRGAPLFISGSNWNWGGKLADLVALAAVCALLVAAHVFTRQQLGLTTAQKQGTGAAVMFCIIPLLFLFAGAVWSLASHEVPTAETLAYQATMPGFAEELCYRGILLTMFDAMFPPTRKVLGAEMGYGAVATSLLFAAAHAFEVGRPLDIDLQVPAAAFPLFAGFFLAWICARTGSLLLPVATHNALNLIANIVPIYI